MPLPDHELRHLIWAHYLNDYLPARVDLREISRLSEGMSGAQIEMICLDVKRCAILRGHAAIDERELHRRLGLTIALDRGQSLGLQEDEIRWLREWDPKYFTLRVLSALYDTSQRQIKNALEETELGNKGHA